MFLTNSRKMKMKNNDFQCWIDYEFKSYYLDSSKQGLRIIFSKGISNFYRTNIRKYISFLRKRYFFPMRCYVYITYKKQYQSDGRTFSGHFTYPTGEQDFWPSIHLACKAPDSNEELKNKLFALTGLLTFYYQWYFFLHKERTHRSLMIEAGRMASYLVTLYIDENGIN